MNGRDGGAGDEARRVLEERARRLAQPVQTQKSTARAVELLRFNLAQERYAIETSFVRSITRIQGISRMPGLPRHFAGVINLHGEIVPLVDLCSLIGVSGNESTESSQTIILGRERAEFGIVADDAEQIESISMELFKSAAAEKRSEHGFVHGVLLDGVVLLDAAALLDDPRLSATENAAPALSPEGSQ